MQFVVNVSAGIAALPQQAPEASVCTAEDYRRALRKHYAVVQSSLKVDIIGFAKRLYSEDHITKECIKEVRAMLKADRQVEAADHMYVALEDLTDAGLCFFVEDVLESQGLSELVKTFRSCPGPRKCSLNPESLHHGTTSVKSAPRVVQLRLTATDASTGMHGAEVAAVPAVVSDNGEVRSSSSSDKCEAVVSMVNVLIQVLCCCHNVQNLQNRGNACTCTSKLQLIQVLLWAFCIQLSTATGPLHIVHFKLYTILCGWDL